MQAVSKLDRLKGPNYPWPTAAVIPYVMTGCPVITKWDYNTLKIPTVFLKDIQQPWESQMYCYHPIF